MCQTVRNCYTRFLINIFQYFTDADFINLEKYIFFPSTLRRNEKFPLVKRNCNFCCKLTYDSVPHLTD